MSCLLALVLLAAAQNKKPPPPPPPPPANPVEIEKMADAGQTKYLKGDYAGALVEFNRILKLDPGNARATSNRGLCQAGLKQYDKALLDFAKALELDPRHTYAFVGQGDVYLAKHQYEEAIVSYSKAIDINPLHPAAHALRGIAWVSKNRYQQAKLDFDRAGRLLSDAKDAPALCYRGVSKHWTHDFAGAEADLTKAIDLSPRYPLALLYRGRNRILTGKARDAQSDLRRAVELEPKDGAAGLLLGDSYAFDSVWPDAVTAWKKAFELDPSVEDEARLRIWRVRARSGERDSAIKELQDWAKKRMPPLGEGDVKETFDFFVGTLSQQQFMVPVSAGDDRAIIERRCARLADAGLLRLLEKDQAGAEAIFQKALETEVKDQLAYAFAASQLPKK